jgi:hypothetical protein
MSLLGTTLAMPSRLGTCQWPLISFYTSQQNLTVGLPGVESRVPTSPARQCLCRGPTLLVFVWVFAFGRQVGDAPVLFEKSAFVLEVHFIEAIS